ncbi:unnamed protein product [Penicillium salamii]|uniref:FAD-binding PCMH-type domain-containing protein n=1 Tax=Penicillium salamii TaxID=1612424 RepID=A0A9W4JBP7_9EURO|nr:unnamed protein product [Penicillium salamii]CAG8202859.1 unnamed protein product [Penicillium salamii]CAG8203612.1 unnamed protein product [Penicillium salamii]CAG8212751.1 unnamed protein product [Penicillium salamii]CAG8218317.1 unnamed protein product [Penicillium salamii]
MVRLAISKACLGLLAIVETVSSTPVGKEFFNARSISPSQELVWPTTISSQIHSESWPDFANKTQRWSSYKAPTFDEVFLPKDEHDLALGLEFMSSNNMSWLARSGGHGYSPTLQSIQDAVLVNLENFKEVNIQSDGTVVVGTGVYFDELINTVGAAGRELTVGACPCVGATGAMLGGGLGRLQGLHGLTSDALRKVRLVLWNGTIVEASDDQHQDLFWGIRGSGQNYGIVFESTYETWPATNGGLHYSADMVFAKSSIETVMEITNNLTNPALDEKLSIVTFFSSNATEAELMVIVNVVYSGPKEEGQKYTELFSPYSMSLQEHMLKWEELPTQTVLGLIPFSCTSGPRYDLYSVTARTLPPSTWAEFGKEFEDFMQQYPAANGSSMMIETFPIQGVEALSDEYSAFPHRKYFHNIIEVIGAYTDDSVAEPLDDFIRSWRDKFAASSGYDDMHVYQNYAHDDEPLSALYGKEQWRHERLTEIKNSYDPHGFFNGYHAVPLELRSWN